jgi:hypothetical protein
VVRFVRFVAVSWVSEHQNFMSTNPLVFGEQFLFSKSGSQFRAALTPSSNLKNVFSFELCLFNVQLLAHIFHNCRCLTLLFSLTFIFTFITARSVILVRSFASLLFTFTLLLVFELLFIKHDWLCMIIQVDKSSAQNVLVKQVKFLFFLETEHEIFWLQICVDNATDTMEVVQSNQCFSANLSHNTNRNTFIPVPLNE